MSKRNKYKSHDSYRSKRTGKKIAMFIACALLGAMLATGFGVITNGYNNMNPTEWFEKEANESNLIKIDDNYIATHNTNRGVKITVNEKSGEIKLTGKATSAQSVTVQTVKLQPGTYKIGGMKDVNLDKMYLGVEIDGHIYKAGVADGDTFTVAQETDARVYLSWIEDCDMGLFGTKVTPEIVAVTETAAK